MKELLLLAAIAILVGLLLPAFAPAACTGDRCPVMSWSPPAVVHGVPAVVSVHPARQVVKAVLVVPLVVRERAWWQRGPVRRAVSAPWRAK